MPDLAGSSSTSALLSEREFGMLRWRCRRGMLENDLLIERFFTRHGHRLTQADASLIQELMDLADNDLLDILLARKPAAELGDAFARPEMGRILSLMQAKH